MNRFEDFALHLKSNDIEWFKENADNPLVTSRLILNGNLKKNKALELFRDISGDNRVTMRKLTTELKLNDIGVTRLWKGRNRIYYYTWK